MKLDKNKLYYLASPYSAPTKHKMHQNYVDITRYGAMLTHVFNVAFIMPITTSHQLKIHVPDLGTSWEFWQHVDIKFLSRCDGIVVVKMRGWEHSIGVTAEIAYAEANNLDVHYITEEEINALYTKKLKVKCPIYPINGGRA